VVFRWALRTAKLRNSCDKASVCAVFGRRNKIKHFRIKTWILKIFRNVYKKQYFILVVLYRKEGEKILCRKMLSKMKITSKFLK
jgi:hypothetical protein